MKERSITELYKTQISLTEWFQHINHEDTDAFREEDSSKRKRLELLEETIGLPKEAQTNFSTKEVLENTPRFQTFMAEHGHEKCAMRLIPLKKGLPKLRMRGHTIKDVVKDWFPQQKVNPEEYTVEFMAHSGNPSWSTIFIVNSHGIFGEIVPGFHCLLTQGFYTDIKPISFSFDFETKTWESTPHHEAAIEHMKTVIPFLKVESKEKQKEVQEKVQGTFSNNYLQGYFETVDSHFGTWFIDYNKILGEKYKDFTIKRKVDAQLSGHIGSPGRVQGTVRIVTNPTGITLQPTDILVCDMTSPAYIQLMQQAAAVVTDRGGMLSHAAIIAREIKKPCIVGTGNATEQLNNGDLIEVDADTGVIRKIS